MGSLFLRMSKGGSVPKQHEIALKLANEIRLGRAAIRRKLAAGELDVRDLILDPPPELDNLPVFDLLTYQHRWQRTRALRVLVPLGISEFMTVGKLTDRQRDLLVLKLS